jgi:hypothetical protein
MQFLLLISDAGRPTTYYANIRLRTLAGLAETRRASFVQYR